jgi:hypothetical protein
VPVKPPRPRQQVSVAKLSAEQLAGLFEYLAAKAVHVMLVGPFAHRKPPYRAPLSRTDGAP